MAGPLGILSSSSGGMLSNAVASIDAARPHILGDLMKQTTGNSSIGSSLSSLTSILTDRPTIFRNRMASVQTAPTIFDKVKAAVEPPTTAAAAPAKEYTPPMRQLASGSTVEMVRTPSNITFR